MPKNLNLTVSIHPQPTPNTVAKATSKMSSRFAAVTNEEISQIIGEAVSDKQEEGDKIRFRSFYICLFNLNLSMKPVKKIFV